MSPSKAFFLLARTDSSRLPGKIFLPLNEVTLLELVVSQLKQLADIPVYLVTSDRTVDDELCHLASGLGCSVYRGSINNVSKRIVGAIEASGVDAFFRINGDSPCIDVALIEQAAKLYDGGSYDFVSNLVTRTYPYGVSVELINSASYCNIQPRFSGQQLEHPTQYLYDQLDDFDFAEIRSPEDNSDIRLTIDTLDDYIEFVERLRRHPDFFALSTQEKINLIRATDD